MRLDELAQRAGVPARTIRYYTQQQLLHPPKLHGRVGVYDSSHLERLRLIRELREKRFLPLSVIKTVVRRFEAGVDLETMLAPLDMVYAPQWDAYGGREFTRTQLAAEAGVDRSVVAAAEEMQLLFPIGSGRDRRYTADDVHMLGVVKEWLALGLPKDLAILYRRSFEAISARQVESFQEFVNAHIAHQDASPEQKREKTMEAYMRMGRTFDRLVSLLHRKLLQQAVESYARAHPGE